MKLVREYFEQIAQAIASLLLLCTLPFLLAFMLVPFVCAVIVVNLKHFYQQPATYLRILRAFWTTEKQIKP